MTWTAQAEALAEDAREMGGLAAIIHAAAWSAGVDPQATQGLTGAALALGATVAMLMARTRPLREDREMTSHAADIEADTADLLKRAQDMLTGAGAALEEAHEAAAKAERDYRGALTQSREQAALQALDNALACIADCEAALEILADLAARLDYARTCLERVPDDLLTTYEVPYDHIRHGGRLPFHGDFLTEDTAAATEEGAA